MADMFGGALSGVSGVFSATGGAFVQTLILVQIPLAIAWLILTAVIVWQLFFRRTVVVNPFWPISDTLSKYLIAQKIPIISMFAKTPWIYKITMIRPFADLKTYLSQDKGALIREDGIVRFKLKKQEQVMQKPDTTNVYPNDEILVASLGPGTKMMATREIDYKEKVVRVGLENPQIASLYSADRVDAADPSWLLNKFREISMLLTFWVIATILNVGSGFLVVYPVMVRTLFWGA